MMLPGFKMCVPLTQRFLPDFILQRQRHMCKNEIMDMSYFSKTLTPFPPLSLVTALRKRKQPQKDTEAHSTPTSPSLLSHPTFCRQPCPPCLDLLPLVSLRASLCIDFPPLYWTIFTAYKHVVLVPLTPPPHTHHMGLTSGFSSYHPISLPPFMKNIP